jgi:hypothetical protein
MSNPNYTFCDICGKLSIWLTKVDGSKWWKCRDWTCKQSWEWHPMPKYYCIWTDGVNGFKPHAAVGDNSNVISNYTDKRS